MNKKVFVRIYELKIYMRKLQKLEALTPDFAEICTKFFRFLKKTSLLSGKIWYTMYGLFQGLLSVSKKRQQLYRKQRRWFRT